MTVFVHGFTQTSDSWDAVLAVPATDDGVALAICPPVRIEGSFVEAVHSLAVRPDRPDTYVGYSMGGRLCLQLALDHPEVVDRLVLVSASPGIADPHERAARRAADELVAQEIERDGVDAFVERWLTQPLFATLPREASGIDERKHGNTVAGLTHQLRALGQGAQPSNWERLDELGMPVLLVVGELDRKYVEIAHRMAESIADVRVDVIPAAGHACHLEQPERFAQLMSSWLNSAGLDSA